MQRAFIILTILSIASLSVMRILSAGAAQDSRDNERHSYTEIGSTILIEGNLGCPVGTEIKIQGVKNANGPLSNWFWIESIDGKQLDSKLGILVNGISKWKDGTKVTLIGHETGILKFRTLNETNYGKDDPRWKGPYQVIDLTFVVERIVEPSWLRLDKE